MVYVLLCFPSTSFPNCFVNLFSDQKRFNVQMVPIVCCVLLFKQKTHISMCFLSSFCFWSHNDVSFELIRYLCCLWSRTKILSKCSQYCFFLVPETVYDHMITFLFVFLIKTSLFSNGANFAVLLKPQNMISKCSILLGFLAPRKTPCSNSINSLCVSDQTNKKEMSKWYPKLLVLLIENELDIQMVSVLLLCFWSQTRVFFKWYHLLLSDSTRFACPHDLDLCSSNQQIFMFAWFLFCWVSVPLVLC